MLAVRTCHWAENWGFDWIFFLLFCGAPQLLTGILFKNFESLSDLLLQLLNYAEC